MASGESPGTSTILVVDAYDGWRRAVASALEYLGYTVWTADSGRAALALSRRGGMRFDLLLSTLHLSDMCGRELCRRLHGLQPGMRAVYMCWPDDAGKSRHMLHRPFSVREIEGVVRRALWPRGEDARGLVADGDGVLAARRFAVSCASQRRVER